MNRETRAIYAALILGDLCWSLLHRYQGRDEEAIRDICSALVLASVWAIWERLHRLSGGGR